jgi:serine/threonine-protein kinase
MAVERGEIPDLVPGCRIVEKIGEGGMAWVFRAVREASGEAVAVKVLRPSLARDEKARSRFLAEARLLKSLDHENVVRGYEVGRVRGFYLFTMEYVDGKSLLWYIDRKMAFNEDAALYVILQIARALEHLRERRIVHRDVKPGNILLTRGNRVKLCDLGLATRVETGGPRADGVTVGTVQYLSPEQALGQRDLDVRSDIYSLGVTLHQLVVGRLPFEGEDDREILGKQILESLSSPDVKGRVSPHMHYFFEKMMAKDREIRYQDPLELIRDIEEQIRGRKSLTYQPGAVEGLERPFEERPNDREPIARRTTRRASGAREAVRRQDEIRQRLRLKRIKKKRQR